MRALVFVTLLLALSCEKRTTKTTPPAATAQSAAASAKPQPAPAPSSSAAGTDTVSQASPTDYDAGPSVVAEGSVDGKRLRAKNLERLKSDLSAVTIVEASSALELGRSLCEAVVPKRPAATPILLKPNLCGFDGLRDPDKSGGDDGFVGRTTDVDFTRGVVRCLKARGHRQLTIAEGCGISHAYWQQVAERTGYDAMAREEGVKLVAMDDDGVFDVEGDKPGLPLRIDGIAHARIASLLMPKILAEHLDRGLFISLPKIKMHRFSVTSMAIKGMQGTVMLSDARPAYKQKWRMHRELGTLLKEKKAARHASSDAGASKDPKRARADYVATLRLFAERMVDVLELEAPHVVLAEGAPAMGGDGFWKLYPSADHFAVGGTNPVLVDRVGAELLGVWDNPRLAAQLAGHRTSPLIEAAARRFGLNLGSVTVQGSGAHLLKAPRATHFVSMDGFALHSDGATPWPAQSRRLWQGAKEATPSTRATAQVVFLGDHEPTIDGRGDDEVWKRARPVAWDTDWKGRATGTRTSARFAWSKRGLYALFELDGAGLFVDRTRPVATEREGLYREDCVELFLVPDAKAPRRYFEVEVGPFGHFFDLDVELGKRSDTAWSSHPTIATRRDATKRTAAIELRLAAPEIISALKSGAVLPLGLYRMEGKSPRQYLAWSPTLTAKPNFHVPDRFGVLQLE